MSKKDDTVEMLSSAMLPATPVGRHNPDEMVAATWGAAAEYQLQQIAQCVEEAKIDLDRVHSYAKSCLVEMEATVQECQKEAARTLHHYKLGIYNTSDDYATVSDSYGQNVPLTLRNDGPLAAEARDAARANRVATRPVLHWLGSAILTAGTIAASYYGYGEYVKPPAPAPAAAPQAIEQARPGGALTSVRLEIGADGTLILSSTERVLRQKDGTVIYFSDILADGEHVLPEGHYTFIAGWGPGEGIQRGEVTIKASPRPGEIQIIKITKPKKPQDRET